MRPRMVNISFADGVVELKVELAEQTRKTDMKLGAGEAGWEGGFGLVGRAQDAFYGGGSGSGAG